MLLIAPATAHTIAKIANGLADDLLAAIALARPLPCCWLRPWKRTCGSIRPSG
ncbi:MAG: flavoprotein [Anaerolineae bacterium]